jgi:ATP-dependent Lhr-like helicase
MTDDLSNYLISELGFEANNRSPGLDQALNAFLGGHMLQKRNIQEQSIDPIYKGTDCILISATASGKTEAAMIPIAAQLLNHPDQIALYLAPTRALLNDLHKRLVSPLNQLGIGAKVKHGDTGLWMSC